METDGGSLRYAERGSSVTEQGLHGSDDKITNHCRHSVPPWLSPSWCAWKVRDHYPHSPPNSVLIGVFDYSGKTSLIHSIAGELGLDIYVVSLSAKG